MSRETGISVVRQVMEAVEVAPHFLCTIHGIVSLFQKGIGINAVNGVDTDAGRIDEHELSFDAAVTVKPSGESSMSSR
jgi:hypothetical protein